MLIYFMFYKLNKLIFFNNNNFDIFHFDHLSLYDFFDSLYTYHLLYIFDKHDSLNH